MPRCVAELLADVAKHGSVTAVGEAAADRAVRKHFRPEFINRLDKTIIFSPLNAEALRTILSQALARATEREGLADRQIKVRLDEAAMAGMVQAGSDPAYGARPLRR